MAAGNYQVDLTTLSTAEATTGWSDLNVAGGGGGALSIEIDFAIQGTNAITRQVTNNTRGATYNNGATTLGADDHYFVWTVCATPGITDIKSAGGITAVIGNSNTQYNAYYVNGSDTLPQGGMQNYAIYSGSTASTTVGGGLSGNPSIFGSYTSTNGTSKGDNYAIDAIRYGTGYYIFDGDVTNPITFVSASQDNDLNINRYGVITKVPGGEALKGRFVVGQTTASVATQAYFVAENESLTFLETEYAKDDFNQIIFDHPSTQVFINNSTFTGIAANNPGQINFLDASTTGSIVDSTFKSIGKTTLNGNVQVTGSVWNECRNVIQSGSVIFESTFNNIFNTPSTETTSSLISDDPSIVSFNTFNGNGEHFGIEIISTGEYNFQSNTFTGFTSGSTSGSAVLFNPPGGTGNLILNVLGGVDSPSFINLSSGTVTINNNIAVTLTGLRDNTEIRVMENGTNPPIELAGIENATDGTTDDRSFTFSLPSGTVVDINIVNLQYIIQRINAFTIVSDTEIPIQQRFDRNYSNP